MSRGYSVRGGQMHGKVDVVEYSAQEEDTGRWIDLE